MNSKAFRHHDKRKRDNFESLKEKLDDIKEDMRTIKRIDTSEESKKQILDELEQKANEIKERMHDYIDTL